MAPIIDVDAVRTRLTRRFGPEVAAWCDTLPALTNDLAAHWHLALAPAWPNGGTSVVFPCESSAGERLVLKLTPDPEIATGEAAALNAWRASPHAVTLRDADPGRGALLLERILPGTRLADEVGEPERWDLDDLVPMLEDLWRPAPEEELPTLATRAGFLFDLTRRRLDRNPASRERLPPGLLDESRDLARELAAEGPVRLLHGDLHPGNVLRGAPGQRLVAIDPRPCLGDPAFDTVDWVTAGDKDESAVRGRIARLASRVEDIDPGRAWSWCQALAVMVAAGLLIKNRDDPAVGQWLALAPDRR